MARGGIRATALALGLLAGGAAWAQTDERGRGDFNVLLRGGVAGYTGELGELTSTGPAWGVSVNVQPTNIFGFELGYEGSRNGVADEQLLDDPALLRQGASGLLKLAPPFLERIKPFVGAGLGVSYVSVRGEGANLYDSDLIQEVPLAAGIEFNSGALSAGFRTSYRLLVDTDFAEDARPGNPAGNLLEANFTLGGRF